MNENTKRDIITALDELLDIGSIRFTKSEINRMIDVVGSLKTSNIDASYVVSAYEAKLKKEQDGFRGNIEFTKVLRDGFAKSGSVSPLHDAVEFQKSHNIWRL